MDFMSPDNRMALGSYANLNPSTHLRLLSESINIAVFLCGDYCILPPVFVAICPIARNALKQNYHYLREGVIRFPIRETSLGSFFKKKMTEYYKVRREYGGIFQKQGQRFVQDNAIAIIRRDSHIGLTIANKWEEGPDISTTWEPLKARLMPSEIELIRQLPSSLKDAGASVTVAAMKARLPQINSDIYYFLEQALQHDYANIYLNEYDATIIANIPPKTSDFLVKTTNISYDYTIVKSVMLAIGLWDTVRFLSPKEMIHLRSTLGYRQFMQLFERLCLVHNTAEMVSYCYSCISADTSIDLEEAMECVNASRSFPGNVFSTNKLQAIEHILMQTAKASQHYLGQTSTISGTTPKVFTLGGEQMSKVFIVHGTDHAIRDKIDLFLRDSGLSTVVMEGVAHGGRTLPEKFEEIAQTCGFAVFILSPDDLLYRHDKSEVKRARQNVVLELGYFWGQLGRKLKFALLVDPTIEFPTDIQGIGWIEITPDLAQTKLKLRKELEEAGLIGK